MDSLPLGRAADFALASALNPGYFVAARPISASSAPIRSASAQQRSVALSVGTLLAFAASGCTVARLPPCVASGDPLPPSQAIPASRQALIGIDGSDSMAGFLNGAGGGEPWKQLLRAIKLTASGFDAPGVYRLGGSTGSAVEAISEAADPCFFGGCPGGRPSVASSLQTLWTIPKAGPVPPLRVMVSDLEVNQGDISALRQAIQADLAKGASIGVLGVRLPFEGTVFDSNARRLHVGKANRPVYLLTTGSRGDVEAFLAGVRRSLALSGFTGPIELSLLGAGPTTLKAATAWGDPRGAASTGLPVRIGGATYGPGGNDDYQLVKLLPGATGLQVSSARTAAGSKPDTATPAPPGLMTLAPIALASGASAPQGVSVAALAVSGRDLTASFVIPPGSTAGVFRGTVAAGTLPEQWWLEWNRDGTRPKQARDLTDNLLLTLTTLSQAAVKPGSPPAAAFCVAFTT